MNLDDAIIYAEDMARINEVEAKVHKAKGHIGSEYTCIGVAEHHRQVAEWLRELKGYKDLSTYNRENKCCECEYEDSEYYCDDCIWNFVDKFKQREVNTDDK